MLIRSHFGSSHLAQAILHQVTWLKPFRLKMGIPIGGANCPASVVDEIIALLSFSGNCLKP